APSGSNVLSFRIRFCRELSGFPAFWRLTQSVSSLIRAAGPHCWIMIFIGTVDPQEEHILSFGRPTSSACLHFGQRKVTRFSLLNEKTQRWRATEPQMQTARAIRHPLK